MSERLLHEATEVAVKSYAEGARIHKGQEPRRRQWLRVRDALRAVVDSGLLVAPVGEDAAYNAGYAAGRSDRWVLSDPWSHEDWKVVTAVAEELSRQRGLVWADQGNDVRVVLTEAAASIIRAAVVAMPNG